MVLSGPLTERSACVHDLFPFFNIGQATRSRFLPSRISRRCSPEGGSDRFPEFRSSENRSDPWRDLAMRQQFVGTQSMVNSGVRRSHSCSRTRTQTSRSILLRAGHLETVTLPISLRTGQRSKLIAPNHLAFCRLFLLWPSLRLAELVLSGVLLLC